MNIDIYTTYDLPVPYRGINIYPVLVKDYLLFNLYSGCLTIDKNSIPDPNIISMSYLEYIYYTTTKNPEETPYLFWLDRLLSLCIKEDESFLKVSDSIQRYGYNEKNRPFFKIGENIFLSEDFDDIKEIIAQQNMVELVDENISKEVRDSLDKAREFKRKISGSKSTSVEDYIISLSLVTGWSLEYIYSLTIRKFLMSIKRADNLLHYKIYLNASMSGMVQFKDTSFIKHWLTNLDDSEKYGDVSIDLQEIEDKISFESAK